MKVRQIVKPEIDSYLHRVDMAIGQWGQLVENSTGSVQKSISVEAQAPRDAMALLNFSQHVGGWLSGGEWALLQFDNSNFFNKADASLIGQLCFGCSKDYFGFDPYKATIFEFDSDDISGQAATITMSHIIYAVLLLEGHAQIITSTSGANKYLSLQDGFVYFLSNDDGAVEARNILERLSANPLGLPSWLNDVIQEDDA